MKKPSATETRTVAVKAFPIELCQLMKFAGLSGSGGEAKQAIAEGLVSLNGEVETRKRKKLQAADRVSYAGQTVIVQLE